MVNDETKQAIFFMTLIIGLVMIVGVLALFDLLSLFAVLALILIVLVIMYLQFPNYFTEVKQYERAVVFRMGKFLKVAEPGWLFVIQFIDSFKVLDMREVTVDLTEQHIVTEDNIELIFNTVLYMKVTNPKKAVINVADYETAAKKRVQARLRGIAGNMKMTEIVSNVDDINEDLFEYMAKVEDKWGLTFTNVEIQSVEIPERIQKSIQERRAATEDKLGQIERAKGAKGEIDQVREAADKLGPAALQYYYLQTLEKMSKGKSSKIIFPLELSKLATGLSDKLTGIGYEEAQEKIAGKYEELKKEGKDKESIIEELERELKEGELEEELKKEKKQKKEEEND